MKFFKEMSNLIKTEVQGFIDFVSARKLAIFWVIFIALLAYGFEIANFTLSIDEERAIFHTDWNIPTVWIGQGRPGITLLKSVFNTVNVIPFWNTFMAVFVLLGAALVWFRAFTRTLKPQTIKSGALFVFCSIFLTMPVHAEYMAFSTYNFEISCGFFLAALSTLFLSHWFTDRNKAGLILGMITYIAALTIYQSFIMVVFCGLSIFLVLYLNNRLKQKESITIKDSIMIVLQLVGLIAIGVIAYKAIDLLLQNFFPSSGYIEGFFWWTYLDSASIIAGLRKFLVEVIFGDKIFGSILIFPTLIVVAFLSVYYLLKGKEFRLLLSFLMLGIGLSPFALSLLIGSPTPLRAMQALPLMLAGVWLILYQTFDWKIIRNLLLLTVILISLYQAQSMTRLFYSDNQRYAEDIAIANRIGERISLLPPTENPNNNTVVFVGKYVPKNNPSIIRSEILGRSFFEWENGNTYRIIALMNNLGYNYAAPTKEQIDKAQTSSDGMPEWPRQGSVEIKDSIIIVKLSEYK